jgi:hypothetical protein
VERYPRSELFQGDHTIGGGVGDKSADGPSRPDEMFGGTSPLSISGSHDERCFGNHDPGV